MNRNFWKNKRVLITGFEGFLGSNLTKALISSGAKIAGLDIKVHRKETILTKDDYRKIIVIKGSVTHYRLLEKILRKNKINIVFHLAAEAIVGKCHNNPLCAFATNIMGTCNVLEACANIGGIEAVVVASSDKAYGSHKKLPYKEDAPLLGNHPYDVSKSCADLIAATYFHSYGLPVAVTRCGNIYGPGDFNMSRLVPDAIRCGLRGKTLQIRSDGMSVRDYIFVDDIIHGYFLLAENLQRLRLSGGAFNFSNEHPVKTLDMVKLIFQSLRRKPRYRILNTSKMEIKRQFLDSRKARRRLRWKPAYSLCEGLQYTIAWYAHHMVSHGARCRRGTSGSGAT
ncbi:MAG: NAD-dependent epimerase/dehydratase family protein [Candidatus Velamenicoccus archaeovorus]